MTRTVQPHQLPPTLRLPLLLRRRVREAREAVERVLELPKRLERALNAQRVHQRTSEVQVARLARRLAEAERMIEELSEEAHSGEFAAPAVELAADLEERLGRLERRLQGLEQQLDLQRRQLSELWTNTEARRRPAPSGADVPDATPPREERPPRTVAEAVARARAELADALHFGDQVDEGVAGLDPNAGPPAKVLAHLRALAEAARTRKQEGNLGMPMADWLDAKGFSASMEKGRVRRNIDERAKRTWRVDGEPLYFDEHLKPSNGTHPGRCVRIYFRWDEERGKVLVGWVGRHP